MHPQLWHGSGPNLSKTLGRRTLLTGFCAYGANSKPYPGADVSIKCLLNDDGNIIKEPAPWHTSSHVTDGAKMH
jgi:hypothetical protein